MYVCKYATLQACQDEMAAPLDLSISVCEALQLNSCQFVLQVNTYTIIKQVGSDYIADLFFDASCSVMFQSKRVSGSKCTSVYEVRFAVTSSPPSSRIECFVCLLD